jgi:hypothetical protein
LIVTRPVKVFVPEVDVWASVPDTDVVPVTVTLLLPTVNVAPEGTDRLPVVVRVPVLVPVMVPPVVVVIPPAPIFVVRACVQLAVPLIVRELAAPGLLFMVTVAPALITTSSVFRGTCPQLQVPAVPQLPLPAAVQVAAWTVAENPMSRPMADAATRTKRIFIKSLFLDAGFPAFFLVFIFSDKT